VNFFILNFVYYPFKNFSIFLFFQSFISEKHLNLLYLYTS
jgi:hypothetical protein